MNQLFKKKMLNIYFCIKPNIDACAFDSGLTLYHPCTVSKYKVQF